LLLYTGRRRSDVVLFGRQHVHNGWLNFTQRKNRNRRPITLQDWGTGGRRFKSSRSDHLNSSTQSRIQFVGGGSCFGDVSGGASRSFFTPVMLRRIFGRQLPFQNRC
jgi:hypothetical protein